MDKSIINSIIPWKNANFYTEKNDFTYFPSNVLSQEVSTQPQSPITSNYNVDIPLSTAKSMEGKYFVGTAVDINFGSATNGWARLYNPPESGVNLFINAWTISDITSTPYRMQIWFNSTPPGIIQESDNVTPANTAINPLPKSKIRLQYGSGAKGFPTDGILAFGRSGLAGSTIEEEEQGRFIFPPGGSFTVYLSNPVRPTLPAVGRVAFGWWEEPVT